MSDTPENEALRSAIQGIVDAQLAMDSASRSAHNGPNTWRLCEETRVAYLAAKLKLDEAIANLARQHPQQDRAPQGEAVACALRKYTQSEADDDAEIWLVQLSPGATLEEDRLLSYRPWKSVQEIPAAAPSDSIDAAQPAQREDAPVPTCGWYQEDEDSDCYTTGCGHAFSVLVGSEDIGSWAKFCCYCGKKIDANRWQREPDEDDAAIAAAQSPITGGE